MEVTLFDVFFDAVAIVVCVTYRYYQYTINRSKTCVDI